MTMHWRRGFRQSAACSVGLLAVAVVSGLVSSALARAADDAGRPNFLFIITDDQRWDALGCASGGLVHTPHLDALARRGTRFASAFVTLSICSPSRAACLTGLYGSRNGVTTLDQALRDPQDTFAHRFRRAGYRTAHFGKWHLKDTPQACGFDQAAYFLSNGAYYGRTAIVDGQRHVVDGYIDDFVAERSVAFLRQVTAESQPFLVWMCTQVPHMDHRFDWPARQMYLDRYDQQQMPVPETWRDDLSGKPDYLKTARSRTRALEYGYDQPENIQRHRKRYSAAVTQVDASIGRVLQALNELGLTETTYVFLMGDNGWLLGEHGFTSKVLAYEESIRVPMLIAGPGVKPQVLDQLVLNVDLPATMYDLADLAQPENIDGRSLAPLLQGQPVAWRAGFLYEAPRPTLGSWPIFAVRTERHKLIRTYDVNQPSELAFTELYDLVEDPCEMQNLAGDLSSQALLQSLSDQLDRRRADLADSAADGSQAAP